MTTPHERALDAALNTFGVGPDKYSTTQSLERAISAYLSSIGGVVCSKEPVGYATELELKQLKLGATVVDLFRNGISDSSVVPLHTPIEAGNGDGWNDDMSKAPRDRSAILLVTNTGRVTVGHWLDNSQTSWPWVGWSTDAGPFAEGRITHWRPLPAPPSRSTDGREE